MTLESERRKGGPASTRCDWCEVDSGRFQAQRACCQLRELANGPPAAIEKHKAAMTEAEWAAFRPLLAAEWQRLRLLRTGAHQPGNMKGTK